jgi:tetratricopeptide (TPR) repeat protein
LFSERTFPERRLRALCMPYLGGASLSQVLEALAPIPPSDRRGRDIIHMLDRAQAAGGGPAPADGPYRRNLENVSYVDAICWIGTRLADALQEAHAHGLVHMDVKPSNVLIAADGSPMLLDFHLASRPLATGDRFPGRIGGTPGWMAPEQRAALDAVAGGEPIPGPVDQRADIYALGLLLREALGGPAGGEGGPPLRDCNPGVSVGLNDIIGGCLAPRPSDRYPSAAAVADDLRSHLDHQPLRGVANRCLRERWRKWRRRRPSALGRWAIGISSACLAAIVAGAWWWIELEGERGRVDLWEGETLCKARRYDDAEYPLRQGLQRAEISPVHRPLADALRAQLRVAHRGQRARSLHQLADRVRFRYGIDPPAGPEAAALLRNVRTIWGERHLLLDRKAAPIDPEDEERIPADLLELVATWAEVRTRLAAASEWPRAEEEARAMLAEARAAATPGEPTAPRSAFDHYDLGRSLLRGKQFAAAAEQFRLSLDERPSDFWPNFYLGLCEYRLGHFEAALHAFTIGIVIENRRPEVYFNRAMAAEALGRLDAALKDYNKALKYNPGLTSAWLNRGLLHFKAGRAAEAVKDLRHALRTANDAKQIGRIHYNLALIHLGRGDRASATVEAEQAAEAGDKEGEDLLDRLGDGRDVPAPVRPR